MEANNSATIMNDALEIVVRQFKTEEDLRHLVIVNKQANY